MAEIDDLIVKRVKMFLLKLKESGVSVDSAYLFGSYAKRSSKKFSDIDVAVISSDFSDDRFEEGIKLAMIAGQIDNRIEPVPFTPGGCPGMPFFLTSALCSKNYPRNINYMSAVIF